MSSVATRTRVNQITIMVGISFLFFVLTNWEQGIWVVYSTLVAAGPLSTFLGFQKGRDRFLGTLAGVLVAFCLEYYLRFNPSHLPVVAFFIALIAGFMVTRPYKYFIVIITICTCMGYTYMNMPYTSFAPTSFVMDRVIGVFVGVSIFYICQRFIFGTGNSKLELLEESAETLKKLQATLIQYRDNPTLVTAYQCAEDVFTHTRDINSYIETAHFVFGHESNFELRYAKQVVMLNNRALKLLVDEASTTVQDKINKLLHIVELKLERQSMNL
ncbi:FUSC family protein [Zwartia panacis]|uniref:FUSC family protein n=1 Tax=Zwartia panacis TaxID=2683345 RepID=UPI0025B44049|nr:FUSC family protein [Zwartia panacis]MDN4016550.1 FUSC family protein [Zwartia panacis]